MHKEFKLGFQKTAKKDISALPHAAIDTIRGMFATKQNNKKGKKK